MNFFQAIGSGFKNYVNFNDRASRSEYWYWILFFTLGRIVTVMLDVAILQAQPDSPAAGVFSSIFSLATFLPTLAVDIRRLHDVDRSGWWVFVSLTIIGLLFPLLYWKCIKGTDGPNRFGPDPLGMGSSVSVFE